MLSALFTLAVLGTAPDASAAGSRGAITEAVSPLFPAQCAKAEIGGKGGLRCAGLVGTDVFVAGAETARRVSIGRPDGRFPVFPRSYELGRTLIWRIDGDQPQAAIVRLRFEGAVLLAVLKVGTAREAGCLAALIDGDAPDDGASLARQWADKSAPGFRCGHDAVRVVGAVGAWTRRVILPWLGTLSPQ